MSAAQLPEGGPAPVAADAIADLQVELSALLSEITATAELVADLADSHQHGLGFKTHEAKAAAGAQHLKDRRDRALADSRNQAHGPGARPTPGSWPGLVVAVELWASLRQQIARAQQALGAAGICTLHRARSEATPGQLAGVLRALVMDLNHPAFGRLLATMRDDLTRTRDAALALVDGNDRSLLGDCPWCAHLTLVVYFRDHLVRCGRDERAGRYKPCVCPDPLCACKVDPIAHRHTWYRAKGTAVDGWLTLARLRKPGTVADGLALARAVQPKEPK